MRTSWGDYLGPDCILLGIAADYLSLGSPGFLVSSSRARFAANELEMRLSMRLLAMLEATLDLGRGVVDRLWPRRR